MREQVLTLLGFCVGTIVGTFAAIIVTNPPPPPAPVVVEGTVERRIHLTMDSRWDSDRRRAFVCREDR